MACVRQRRNRSAAILGTAGGRLWCGRRDNSVTSHRELRRLGPGPGRRRNTHGPPCATTWPRPPRLVLVCGLPTSGRSTLGLALVRCGPRFRAAWVAGDAVHDAGPTLRATHPPVAGNQRVPMWCSRWSASGADRQEPTSQNPDDARPARPCAGGLCVRVRPRAARRVAVSRVKGLRSWRPSRV